MHPVRRENSSPQRAFDAWIAATGLTHPTTLRTYQSIWNVWLVWLSPRAPWDKATRELVQAFLGGAAQGTGRRRAPTDALKMASATMARYHRVLHGVYNHALQTGAIDDDPTSLGAHKPVADQASRLAQVTPPFVLGLLQRPDSLADELAGQYRDDMAWTALRDRCAVALVANCALTTAELIALQGADLRQGLAAMGEDADYHGEEPGSAWPEQALLPAVPEKPIWLHVRAQRKGSKDRELPVPVDLASTLREWLQERRRLVHEDWRRLVALGVDPPQCALREHYPLLLSTHLAAASAGNGLQPRPGLDASTVYRIFSRYLAAAYETPRVQALLDPDARVAQGAGIVRSAVLADWLRHHSEQEVAAMAGLRSVASLRVLKQTLEAAVDKKSTPTPRARKTRTAAHP